jgi:ABC-type nitrate/sulfonate/bicarbonate transport system permease component
MPPFVRTLFEAILGLAIIAVAWVIATAMVDDATKLPSLAAVVQKAIELALSDDYLRHFGDSGTALLLGLLPALVAAVFLGMIAGMSRTTRWLFGPFAVTLGGAPLVALVPMFLTWWGLTIVAKAVTVFVMVAFPIMNMVMVQTGAKRSDGNPARTAGAIIGGLRVGVLIGVTALIIAEFMASSHGVGFFIAQSAGMFDTTATMAGIVLVAVPTILVAAFLQAIEEQVAG